MKLIIFDLDGTLIDAYAAIIQSFNYVMRELGYPGQSPAVIRKAVGWGDKNLLAPFIDNKVLKKGLRLYRNHHKQALINKSRLYPGVKSVLTSLKSKGYKLAVASNRPTVFSMILIRHLGLKKYFDYCLCADKLRHGKPHPEIINKIIRRFQILRNQVYYVGDMAIDAQAGRRAKVKTIIVTGGSSSISEIKKELPYRIIRNIKELVRLV